MIPGIRLVLLGKQGAGKGTQCVRLARHYVVSHVSTGDIFRAAVRSESELGKRVKGYLDAGELVPDEVTLAIVGERLNHPDTRSRGFILDGFPRSVNQAKLLDELLDPVVMDMVIDLHIPTEEALQRLNGRRVCSTCGAIYHVSRPPKYDWTCDNCGGEVVQRDDDTDDAIRRRLQLYEDETAPLIDYYFERGMLVTVDGLGSTDEVADRLTEAIDRHRGRGMNA
ncbi:MAG TPA: adenylate kinase [Acidimicrobiales bacterium]|nr:adenylate kinase [Acidimicrobiales bacterium]